MKRAREVADRAADVAVSAIGNAAGATVAPGTALAKLRAKAGSPTVIALAVVAVVAFLAGRMVRREGRE